MKRVDKILRREIEKASENFVKPEKDLAAVDDIMLIYFLSHKRQRLKLVEHNFAYPLGHILTARGRQNVSDDGLHLTVAETGGQVRGKKTGSGFPVPLIMTYDFDKFKPHTLMKVIEKHKVNVFGAAY